MTGVAVLRPLTLPRLAEPCTKGTPQACGFSRGKGKATVDIQLPQDSVMLPRRPSGVSLHREEICRAHLQGI